MASQAPPPTKRLGPEDPPLSGGGGLFGSTTTTTNTGGGLFGSTTTTTSNTGGGLFGSTSTTTTTSNTGGSLFGTTTSTTTSNTGGGLFGSTTTTNTGGGLFGTTTSTTTSNTGGGLFGSTTNNASGGLFGTTGNNANTGNPLNNLFGSPGNQVNIKVNTFDEKRACWNNGTLYIGYLSAEIQKYSSNYALYKANRGNLPSVLQAILDIYIKYNPCAPECAFTTFFYTNLKSENPAATARMMCANTVSNEAWDAAMKRERSDKTAVPVLYRGFRGVGYHAEEIATKNAELKKSFDVFRSALEKDRKNGTLISAKLAELKKRQDGLALRLMKVATGMMASGVSGGSGGDEEELFSKLEMLRYRMSSAQSVKEKAQELCFKKDRIKIYAGLAVERKRELVLNQETMDALTKHLMQQQKSILQLAQVLDKAKERVEEIEKASKKDK